MVAGVGTDMATTNNHTNNCYMCWFIDGTNNIKKKEKINKFMGSPLASGTSKRIKTLCVSLVYGHRYYRGSPDLTAS